MIRRLHDSHDIQDMFRSADSIHMPACIVKSRPNAINTWRIGVIIPKKQVAKAHDRNRMKRRLKEALRRVLPYNSPRKYDILVLGSNRLREYSFDQYIRELTNALHRLGIH